MLLTLILSFLIYAVILFVVSYIVVEYGQNYLYSEITQGAPLKVGVGAVILAAMLTWLKPGFATMFTSDIRWTVLLAIVWSGVFILVYRFQPWHGFGLAIATLLIFAGLSTLVVDSLTAARPAGRIDDVDKPVQKIRRPTGNSMISTPAETPASK
jgi:hypothetical protein